MLLKPKKLCQPSLTANVPTLTTEQISGQSSITWAADFSESSFCGLHHLCTVHTVNAFQYCLLVARSVKAHQHQLHPLPNCLEYEGSSTEVSPTEVTWEGHPPLITCLSGVWRLINTEGCPPSNFPEYEAHQQRSLERGIQHLLARSIKAHQHKSLEWHPPPTYAECKGCQHRSLDGGIHHLQVTRGVHRTYTPRECLWDSVL